MENIASKTAGRFTGFTLIIILSLLYGDHQAIIMLPDQEPDIPGSWVSDLSRSFVQSIPSYFEMNMGQTHESVKFLSRGKNHTLFLTPERAVLSLAGTKAKEVLPQTAGRKQVPVPECTELSFQLAGSNPVTEINGINKLGGKSNYLIGNDPDRWQKNVPHYEMVKYSNVYDGIDLVYHNRRGNLEYDFMVAPGADPGKIRLDITGAEGMEQDASGNLVLQTTLGDVMIKAPETYQEIDGQKEYIASKFELEEGGQISVRLDPYDESKVLVIDPELVYSTYLGGGESEWGRGIDTDNEGNVYLTGCTKSADFPSGNGSPSLYGEWDVYVTKLNTLTSEVVFTTILGGSYNDRGLHIGIDRSKHIYVAGRTYSDDFRVKNAIQSELGDDTAGDIQDGDVFVLKLDSAGSSLVYSTYLGGREYDGLFDAVFDFEGNVYLSGITHIYYDEQEGGLYTHFPVYPNKYLENLGRWDEHFVTKINASGELQYSALILYHGTPTCLAVNTTGNAYILQRRQNWEIFSEPEPLPNLYTIIKLNESGTDLEDSLSILLSSSDISSEANDFQLDAEENIYFAGVANGDILPVTSNAYQSSCSNTDAFIVKLNKDASKVLYASYLGGSQDDRAKRIYIDEKGCIIIYGNTTSADFPTVNAYQSIYRGDNDLFLAEFDPSKEGEASLLFSTYLGGEKYDDAWDFAIDVNQKIYLTGTTTSDSFPVKDALINSLPGFMSAFVAVFVVPPGIIT